MSIIEKSSYRGPHEEIIVLQISNIRSSLRRFEAAVVLFEHARQASLAAPGSPDSKLYCDWRSMAARDAVVTLWTYLNALNSLSASLCKVEIIGVGPDIDAFRSAKKDFLKSFPNIRELRHAVCHLSESMENPEKLKGARLKDRLNAHKVSINAGGLFLENIHNYTFITSWKGKPVSYDLSSDNLIKISDISERVLGAIDLDDRWIRSFYESCGAAAR